MKIVVFVTNVLHEICNDNVIIIHEKFEEKSYTIIINDLVHAVQNSINRREIERKKINDNIIDHLTKYIVDKKKEKYLKDYGVCILLNKDFVLYIQRDFFLYNSIKKNYKYKLQNDFIVLDCFVVSEYTVLFTLYNKKKKSIEYFEFNVKNQRNKFYYDITEFIKEMSIFYNIINNSILVK